MVMLSIVRSMEPDRLQGMIKEASDRERIKRAVFGHLTSENRLCVSMSRQKRALIVVGDAGLFSTPFSREAVEGLYGFYKLCKEKGMVL